MVANLCIHNFNVSVYADDKACHGDGGPTTFLDGNDLVLCDDDINAFVHWGLSLLGPQVENSILIVDILH